MDNYKTIESGVIKQIEVDKITYDYVYSNKYNNYGEKGKYLSYLRFGVLITAIKGVPNSIVDVGYGNGDFLKICKEGNVKHIYGCDISDYPVPEGCKKIDLSEIKNVDVTCFFDSLEHFDDINIIKDIDTEYIFISVPFCHNYNDKWFLQWYHRRPNEHLWHFNDKSLISTFDINGYDCVHTSTFEDIIRKNDRSKNYPNIVSCIFKKRNSLDSRLSNFYKNKSIIVIGGTGFIGGNIVNKLLDYDIKDIYILDRTVKKKWDDKRVKIIKGDWESNLDLLKNIDFDILFHEAIDNSNKDSFVKLVDLCNSKGSKIIYSSSASEFGSIDKYVLDCDSSSPIIGLKYYEIYGHGEEHKNDKMSTVSKIFKNLKENNKVEIHRDKERYFVYIKDVVKINILAGMKDEKSVYTCVYNEEITDSQILDIAKTYYITDSQIIILNQKIEDKIVYDFPIFDYTLRYDIINGIYDYIKNL